MKNRITMLTLCAVLFALSVPAEAQQAKVAKIGELTFGRRFGLGTGRELLRQELAAEGARVKLQYMDIQSPKDVEIAFKAAVKGQADAVLVRVPSPILSPRRAEIAALAVKNRLPVIYEEAETVEAGGLMSYGVNLTDLYRRAATYVDKILKGRKPAELPVEQPTKFEFVINLKATKQIGLTIPPNVLARADKVIRWGVEKKMRTRPWSKRT
jgi:putative ABC transport system substrate-binding protein